MARVAATLFVAAMLCRAAYAETITVPPCGSSPAATTGTYSGVVYVTVGGVIVNTPGNPSTDPFYDVNANDPSMEVQPNPGWLRYDRASEGNDLCDGSASSHLVSGIIVGTYPTFTGSNSYSVTLDLGGAPAEALHFGIADCGCGDNSGQYTLAISDTPPTTSTSTTTTTTTSTTSTTFPTCDQLDGHCGGCLGDGICVAHQPDNSLDCVDTSTCQPMSCSSDAECPLSQACFSDGSHTACCASACPCPPSGCPTTTTTTTTTETTTTITAPGTPLADARAAVAYQIDTAHTGYSPIHLRRHPKYRWAFNAGGLITYPLIVHGTVFVTGVVPAKLHALNERTGRDRWAPVQIPGTYTSPQIAYDRGQVFSLDPDGSVAAFDATAGTMSWTTVLTSDGAGLFFAAPTAKYGILFISGAGKVWALAETDGSLLWTAPGGVGDDSSPAVSSDGVYVSYACENVYRYSPFSGTLLWNYHGVNCYGGGGLTPVLYNGRVYARDDVYSNVILDATNGARVGGFEAGPPPAFADGHGFFLRDVTGPLQAEDFMTNSFPWIFVGDNYLGSPPIVVRRNVFIGSQMGMLYAVTAKSGQEVWSTNVSADIGSSQLAVTSLTAGGHTLVVGASTAQCCTSCQCSTTLVAYR